MLCRNFRQLQVSRDFNSGHIEKLTVDKITYTHDKTKEIIKIKVY